MRFLTSIHDVWPGNFSLVANYLQTLRSLGIESIALLVVPKYHGKESMSKNAEFLTWLSGEAKRGTEIFLHGYHHLKPELIESHLNLRRSSIGIWVNQRFVNYEAEFLGLPDQEKSKILQLGLNEFARAMELVGNAINPIGFVPPTWFGCPSVEMMKKNKLAILETRFFIKNFLTQQSKFVPPLAWAKSKQNNFRLIGGSLWLELLLPMPLIKIAIHPGDFEDPQTLKTIRKVISCGSAIQYQKCFN